MRRWSSGLLLCLGCSVVNHIDVCEQPRSADFTVNRLPADDQYLAGPQSAVALPNGTVAVVWNSDRVRTATNMVPPNAGSVRAGLLEANGAVVTPCRERSGEVTVVAPADTATSHPVIATGAAAGSPVFVAWSQHPFDGAARVFVRALNAQLCALSNSTTSTFEVSEDADAEGGLDHGAFRPTVAVNAAGTRALVAYLARRRGAAGFAVKYRVLGVSMDTNIHGMLLPSPLDNRDAPGVLVPQGLIGVPRLARIGDGFVLVWPDYSEGRWRASWRFLDGIGVPGPVQSTELGGMGDANTLPSLALAVDGDELVLAWDRVRTRAPLQRDVVVQRFARDLSPRGEAATANSSAGDHNGPAVALLPQKAVMVSWDDDTQGTAVSEVRARVLDARGAPLFTSIACTQEMFAPSASGLSRRLASALVTRGDRVLTLYVDASETAPDPFGLAVRGQSFVAASLVPALR